MTPRILIVEDDRGMCQVLEQRLSRRGFEVEWRTTADEAWARIQEEDFSAVVTDLNLGRANGIELAERIATNRPDIPVVVITAFGSMDTAIAAIRSGAYDFITKPFEIETLELTLRRAIQHRALRVEVRRLREAVSGANALDDAIGSSPAMQALRKVLTRYSESEAPVLICGETGTGKELVARSIHCHGARSEGPFVAVNCAAMPATLLESELFGHTRGAFTDARSERRGLFLEADRGTLFLDEIGELSPDLQPKLLRALQDGAVRALGRDRETPFDARIIAATNRDLEADVEEGRFREDLFFRLDVLRVEVPPLRARGTDVLLLAQHFLEDAAARADKNVRGLSPEVAERLLSYSWPGNVRELQNCIERAVALTAFERIAVEDLPERIRSYRKQYVIVASDDPSELVPLQVVERRYIQRVLSAVGGNKTGAARILGLDRKTLYRKLERFERRPAE